MDQVCHKLLLFTYCKLGRCSSSTAATRRRSREVQRGVIPPANASGGSILFPDENKEQRESQEQMGFGEGGGVDINDGWNKCLRLPQVSTSFSKRGK